MKAAEEREKGTDFIIEKISIVDDGSDDAEFCYLLIDKDNSGKLFIYHEEDEGLSIYNPDIDDKFLVEQVQFGCVLIQAYIERE